MAANEHLAPTAHVILGLLDVRPRTGYEIKQVIDGSTRFFWAASYGQIYPELRRLRDAGLVTAESDDAGARKRRRHSITPAGRAELRAWLAAPAELFEYRDEKLLKLFFAESIDSRSRNGAAARMMHEKAAKHAAVAAELREREEHVVASKDPYQLAVLRFGIELNEWAERHCAEAAEELAG